MKKYIIPLVAMGIFSIAIASYAAPTRVKYWYEELVENQRIQIKQFGEFLQTIKDAMQLDFEKELAKGSTEKTLGSELSLRIFPNRTADNATSTASALRYVANSATTTIGEFSSGNADKINVAVKVVASTSPAIASFQFQYGIQVPTATDPNAKVIEWFDISRPVLGPDTDLTSATSTTALMGITILASSTPLTWYPIVSVATSSFIMEVPTFYAPFTRINASIVGSPGAFWMSPIIRDDL